MSIQRAIIIRQEEIFRGVKLSAKREKYNLKSVDFIR